MKILNFIIVDFFIRVVQKWLLKKMFFCLSFSSTHFANIICSAIRSMSPSLIGSGWSSSSAGRWKWVVEEPNERCGWTAASAQTDGFSAENLRKFWKPKPLMCPRHLRSRSNFSSSTLTFEYKIPFDSTFFDLERKCRYTELLLVSGFLCVKTALT